MNILFVEFCSISEWLEYHRWTRMVLFITKARLKWSVKMCIWTTLPLLRCEHPLSHQDKRPSFVLPSEYWPQRLTSAFLEITVFMIFSVREFNQICHALWQATWHQMNTFLNLIFSLELWIPSAKIRRPCSFLQLQKHVNNKVKCHQEEFIHPSKSPSQKKKFLLTFSLFL